MFYRVQAWALTELFKTFSDSSQSYFSIIWAVCFGLLLSSCRKENLLPICILDQVFFSEFSICECISCAFLNCVQSIEFSKDGLQVLEASRDNQNKQNAPELNLECLRQGSGYFTKWVVLLIHLQKIVSSMVLLSPLWIVLCWLTAKKNIKEINFKLNLQKVKGSEYFPKPLHIMRSDWWFKKWCGEKCYMFKDRYTAAFVISII